MHSSEDVVPHGDKHMDPVELIAADAVPMEQLHAALVDAFADYIVGPFQLSAEQMPAFLTRQAVALSASRVATKQGQIHAIALVSLRSDIARWRLATLCAVPLARGTGVTHRLMDDLVSRATAFGASALELECFAQNERAVRLYQRYGFRTAAELRAWSSRARGPGQSTGGVLSASAFVREVGRAEGLAWQHAAARDIPDLPLQVAGDLLATSTRPLRFWQSGTAQLVFSAVEGDPVLIHGLVDSSVALRDAEILVARLQATYPDCEIKAMPQVHRADLGGEALRRLGFEDTALYQLLMVRSLGHAAMPAHPSNPCSARSLRGTADD